MPSRKKTGKRRPVRAIAKTSTGDLQAAITIGVRRAEEALARRRKQRKTRLAAHKASTVERRAAGPTIRPSAVKALGGATRTDVLIAEGDSWFDYPLHDVLKSLEDEHDFDVESVSHRGDRVEDMAYADGQLDDFSRRLEKVLKAGDVPRAILLSGGGNDLAGDEFAMFLNHAHSPIAGLNDDVVTGVVDKRIRTAYAAIIAAITRVCNEYVTQPIPIIIHGYAVPVPDGRGVFGGWWILPGPWLEPGFHGKGFEDVIANTAIMRALIDRFNAMLASVAAAFPHVHYIDLRATLRNDSKYKTDWANELHPTAHGFRLVADRFAGVLNALP